MDSAAPFLVMAAAAVVLLVVLGVNAKKINAEHRRKSEPRRGPDQTEY